MCWLGDREDSGPVGRGLDGRLLELRVRGDEVPDVPSLPPIVKEFKGARGDKAGCWASAYLSIGQGPEIPYHCCRALGFVCTTQEGVGAWAPAWTP